MVRRPCAAEVTRAAAALVLATAVGLSPGSGLGQVDRGLADRVPLDDPAIAPRAAAAATPEPAPQGDGGSYIGAAVGALFGAVTWTAQGIVDLPQSTDRFLWEVAYMLGVNAKPLAPPDPDAPPSRRRAAAPTTMTPPAAPPPAAPVPAPPPANHIQLADVPAQPAAASVQDAPPDVRPPIPVPTMPAGPLDEVDRGLIANFVYDRGSRREDGSYFVPKPLQRLFNVRTEAARLTDVPLVSQIAGQIVPDPSMHGTVQPSTAGRLEPAETGFPSLGQVVRKGAILAWVSPSIGVLDRGQLQRDIVKLTSDIRVETEALEILRQFKWVPFREGKIYQAEQRIAGLRRERDALLPLLNMREALRAPADGVISISAAINGRIVQPGDTVFEIVDPGRLWIEATAPDPMTGEAARGASFATAVTPEGVNLSLRFVGLGLSVARQATPILYRIEQPPPGLQVGRPVSVTVVNTARSQRGILVNRSAVTRGSSGVEEVWEQAGPEVFVPHPVRTRIVDGSSIVVLDGLREGARIVVNGARLMAQLQ